MKPLYPLGRDPLLARWQDGRGDTHPRWADDRFWWQVGRRILWDDTNRAHNGAKRTTRTEGDGRTQQDDRKAD